MGFAVAHVAQESIQFLGAGHHQGGVLIEKVEEAPLFWHQTAEHSAPIYDEFMTAIVTAGPRSLREAGSCVHGERGRRRYGPVRRRRPADAGCWGRRAQ